MYAYLFVAILYLYLFKKIFLCLRDLLKVNVIMPQVTR